MANLLHCGQLAWPDQITECFVTFGVRHTYPISIVQAKYNNCDGHLCYGCDSAVASTRIARTASPALHLKRSPIYIDTSILVTSMSPRGLITRTRLLQ